MAKFVGIRLDIETKSGVDIKRGVHPYCEDPDFEVLLIAYSPMREYAGGAIKLGQPRLLDLNDYNARIDFSKVLVDQSLQKHAYNAQFERVALSKWLKFPNGIYLDPTNWRCSAILANANGVFGSLEEVARAVKSPVNKDTEGKRLIRLFSIRDKKSGKFHDPEGDAWGQCWCGLDHHADFLRYGDYCKQDVVTEAVVARSFPDLLPETWEEYEADQRIGDRGVRHFKGLSLAAMQQAAIEKDRVMDELRILTGVDNPNSVQQMQAWIAAQGYPMRSLNKDSREEALADPMCPPQVANALVLKGAATLSSVSKHKAMLSDRCADGRIRGSLRFYGAHTGREAGRGFQPQNLPRYEAPKEDRARLLLGTAGRDAPEIAKGSARAALVPARDHVFVVFDYNAIEARCLGWESGEVWVQQEFAGAGKIYEATASTMFGVDKDQLVLALKACDKCGKCAHCNTRGKGKVSNLALGYGGAAGALVTMGAEKEGIDCGNYTPLHREWEQAGKPGKFHEWERDRHDYPELIRLRDLYRDASPATVRFWKLCAKAWDVACSGKGAAFGPNQSISMIRDGRHNRLILPSGRSIWYRNAMSHIDPNRVDRDGNPVVGARTFIGKSAGVGHYRTETHGGKLTENITQAIARDVLFDLIMRIEALTAQGWPGRIVLHVHDEVVLEVHKRHASQVFADVEAMMQIGPRWGQGLVVKGEGKIMNRYGK